ncbi:MAG TPA: hypothetical protein VL484_00990 [Vicinamibacterales bacterium]|nr:hypothetical protein [Vicinamibacterales bacterium]
MAAFLAGLVIRVATLTLPGTEDVLVWKTWSYGASSDVTSIYGVGGSPPRRGVITWGTRNTTVDYPPGTPYLLAIVGRAYRAADPSFADSALLTGSIKLLTLLFDACTCVLLWALASRFAGPRVAAAAAVGYWLNPATLMDGAVLGYLDPWMTAPALAALVAADTGLALPCGAALAAAVLIKAQAVLVAPVAALLLWHAAARRWRSFLLASTGFAVIACLALVPFALRGALPNVAQGVTALVRHDMLSGTAANLWWLITWMLRAAYAVKDLGRWAAWTMTVRILGISRVVALGYPNPRLLAGSIVAVAGAWAFFRAHAAAARGVTPAVIVAAGAFAVHAYFVLGVQVHENHLFLAVPLLAVSAAALPQYRATLAAISAISALNLFLFYGIGRGFPLPPRHFTVVDATVVLSALNVIALWHHAGTLSATCESSGRYDRASPGGSG